jgi:hypothetical protein
MEIPGYCTYLKLHNFTKRFDRKCVIFIVSSALLWDLVHFFGFLMIYTVGPCIGNDGQARSIHCAKLSIST